MRFAKYLAAPTLAAALLIAFAQSALAQESTTTIADLEYSFNNIILMISAVLVLFMQAGFALVEVGFNSSKNVINIMFKNLLDMCVGVVIFWLIGFGLMYGSTEIVPGWLAFGGLGISAAASDPAAGGLNPQIDFLFQVAFAATAATIVSGAVAGRIKFSAYLIYTVFISAIVYPIAGFWHWGGGWLAQMGFHDFAGSLVVHSVGGFAGLAGALILGPRIGRFAKDTPRHHFAPHNYAFGTLGVFILLIGWYGFNPGSQLAFVGGANIDAVALVAVNTTLAAATGGIAALLISWFLLKKPDLGYTLNGVLGGLVGITANCDAVTNPEAMLIGVIGGAVVIGGMLLLERLKIDDPVGAFPVHGLGGLWGGIATGIFGGYALGTQILGSLAYAGWSFVLCLGLFGVLRALGQLRVSPEEEEIGLDLTEHGAAAYTTPSFSPMAAD